MTDDARAMLSEQVSEGICPGCGTDVWWPDGEVYYDAEGRAWHKACR